MNRITPAPAATTGPDADPVAGIVAPKPHPGATDRARAESGAIRFRNAAPEADLATAHPPLARLRNVPPWRARFDVRRDDSEFDLSLVPDMARAFHDDTTAQEARKRAHSCSIRVSNDIRADAEPAE